MKFVYLQTDPSKEKDLGKLFIGLLFVVVLLVVALYAVSRLI
jgi:flagellar biogenesis protein FliO